MVKILLVCSAGMSTSILVEKMKIEADKRKLDVQIKAKPISEAQQIYDAWDVILLGPQVSYIEESIKKIVDKPVAVISPQIYALAKAGPAIDLALETIKKKSLLKLEEENNFLFGVSTNAFQIEGGRNKDGRSPSLWDDFASKKNYLVPDFYNPKKMNELPSVGINKTSDFYSRYKEDIRIMYDLGIQAVVYNIDWSRIYSNSHRANRKGIAFYKRVFEMMALHNIQVIPVLYHWDTPLWLEKHGGCSDKDRNIVKHFGHLAATLFKHFGKYAKYWFATNENTFTEFGYLNGYFPPQKKSPKEFVMALHNLNLMAAIAHKEFKKAKQLKYLLPQAKFGIIHNYSPGIPFTKEDEKLQSIYDEWQLQLFLDPAVKGTYPQVFYDWIKAHQKEWKLPLEKIITANDLAFLKENTIDLIGWNYYNPSYFTAADNQIDPSLLHKKNYIHFSKSFQMVFPKTAQYTKWNWIYDATQLKPGMHKLYERYKLPIMITENGYGDLDENEDGFVMDEDRIHFLQSHMHAALACYNEGIPVLGYFAWTYCDIFSPSAGYEKKYGLVGVDFDDEDRRRFPKLSYVWYKEAIKNKGRMPERPNIPKLKALLNRTAYAWKDIIAPSYTFKK